jgi:hypothetical protein
MAASRGKKVGRPIHGNGKGTDRIGNWIGAGISPDVDLANANAVVG